VFREIHFVRDLAKIQKPHNAHLIREGRLEPVEDGERLVGAPVVDEQQVRLRRLPREAEEVFGSEPGRFVETGHHDESVGRRSSRLWSSHGRLW
jgi:hypothetical protein